MPHKKRPHEGEDAQHPAPLRLHPEIDKAAQTLPGLDKVKTRLEPAWKRWLEGIAINLFSAVVGGLFATHFFVTPPTPLPEGSDSLGLICPKPADAEPYGASQIANRQREGEEHSRLAQPISYRPRLARKESQ